MEIYIEDYLLLNLILNFIILYINGLVIRADKFWIRIISATVITVIFSFLYLFLTNYITYFKFICVLIIAIILSEFKIKKIILTSLTLIIITNIVGIITYNIIGFNSSLYDLELSYNKAPFFSIIISLIMLITSKKVIVLLNKKKNLNKLLFEVNINHSDTNLKVLGFYDSGNIMYDGKGKPIIVISKELIENLKLNATDDMVTINTINGVKIVNSYKIKEIEILSDNNKKHYDDITAIKGNRKFNNYKLLLHSEMI